MSLNTSLIKKLTGRFMYIEASAKKPGMKATLLSPQYRGLRKQCAQFYYHMFGRTVGTLSVHTKVSIFWFIG